MKLAAGTSAPDFRALDQTGMEHSLNDYRGQYLLLYFYPKDDTPGCTAQACGLRDSYELLQGKIRILGVSADSVESHENFAKKYSLPFPLLADPEKKMQKAYGTDGILFGHRTSFLIDPSGVILKVFPDVDPNAHAQLILSELSLLEKSD